MKLAKATLESLETGSLASHPIRASHSFQDHEHDINNVYSENCVYMRSNFNRLLSGDTKVFDNARSNQKQYIKEV